MELVPIAQRVRRSALPRLVRSNSHQLAGAFPSAGACFGVMGKLNWVQRREGVGQWEGLTMSRRLRQSLVTAYSIGTISLGLLPVAMVLAAIFIK